MANVFANSQLVQLRVWTKDLSETQAAVNSYWYAVSVVGSPGATDQDFANQLDPVLAPLMKAVMSNNCEYRGVQAAIHDGNYPYRQLFPTVQSAGNIGVGTAGATPLPSQVSGLLKFRSNGAGPAARGRAYIPFAAVADTDAGGSPVAGYLTRVDAIGAIVASGVAVAQGGRSATLVRVLVHRRNKAGIVPAISGVTDRAVSGLWATQKRRGNYGRPNTSPI